MSRSAVKAVESIAIAVTETKFAESNYDKADGVVYRMIEVRLCEVLNFILHIFRRFTHFCVLNAVVS